jgi:ribosomal protein S18 acetylase RimI-like enzyme
MDVRNYVAEEVLRDGAPVRIRTIQPADKTRLAEFHRRLSPESVYFRFFEYKRALTERDLRYLTEVDFDRRVALVATLGTDPDAPIAGVVRYDVLPVRGQEPRRAELGIIVEDAHHKRGIGTALLRHLLGIAHAKGITQIVAEVLPQNTKMLELVAGSGVPVHHRLEDGTIHLTV